jgi:4-hydroxybenzoate polyprenyltransferase
MLKREFKKSERKQMKRVLIISAGVIGVLVGMAFVMPAVALYRSEGTMTINNVGLLLLGFGLTLGGGSVAVFTFKKRKA